jgi:hypothetical protein
VPVDVDRDLNRRVPELLTNLSARFTRHAEGRSRSEAPRNAVSERSDEASDEAVLHIFIYMTIRLAELFDLLVREIHARPIS